MKFVLYGLLAWLCGLVTILGASYCLYETPGIVDAVSYMMILFFACVILNGLVYLPVLYVLCKKFNEHNVVRYAPWLLAGIVNLPLYAVIVWQSDKVFGKGEAVLFFLGFVMVALVFGVGYSKIYRNKITARTSG